MRTQKPELEWLSEDAIVGCFEDNLNDIADFVQSCDQLRLGRVLLPELKSGRLSQRLQPLLVVVRFLN